MIVNSIGAVSTNKANTNFTGAEKVVTSTVKTNFVSSKKMLAAMALAGAAALSMVACGGSGGDTASATPTNPTQSTPVVTPTDPTQSTPVVTPTDPSQSTPVVTPTDPSQSTPVVTPTNPAGYTAIQTGLKNIVSALGLTTSTASSAGMAKAASASAITLSPLTGDIISYKFIDEGYKTTEDVKLNASESNDSQVVFDGTSYDSVSKNLSPVRHIYKKASDGGIALIKQTTATKKSTTFDYTYFKDEYIQSGNTLKEYYYDATKDKVGKYVATISPATGTSVTQLFDTGVANTIDNIKVTTK